GPLGYTGFSREQQRLATLLLVYIVLVDDLVERDPQWRHGDTKDEDLAVRFTLDMYTFWKQKRTGDSPVVKLGMLFFDSLSEMVNERFLRRLSKSMRNAIVRGVLPMQHLAAHEILPDTQEYCQLRIEDFYIFVMLDLIRAYVHCDYDSHNMVHL